MNYNVLIVEDEPVLARNMHLYLERQGLSCQTAGSGEGGWRCWTSNAPTWWCWTTTCPVRTG